jgi:hypothetical protein
MFGVLAHDVTEDNHYGTCLIADECFERPTFQTFSYSTLYKAVETMKDQSYRMLCPTSKLKRLLAYETQNEQALNVRVSESMQTYAKIQRFERNPTKEDLVDDGNTLCEREGRETVCVSSDSDDFFK